MIRQLIIIAFVCMLSGEINAKPQSRDTSTTSKPPPLSGIIDFFKCSKYEGLARCFHRDEEVRDIGFENRCPNGGEKWDYNFRDRKSVV